MLIKILKIISLRIYSILEGNIKLKRSVIKNLYIRHTKNDNKIKIFRFWTTFKCGNLNYSRVVIHDDSYRMTF